MFLLVTPLPARAAASMASVPSPMHTAPACNHPDNQAARPRDRQPRRPPSASSLAYHSSDHPHSAQVPSTAHAPARPCPASDQRTSNSCRPADKRHLCTADKRRLRTADKPRAYHAMHTHVPSLSVCHHLFIPHAVSLHAVGHLTKSANSHQGLSRP